MLVSLNADVGEGMNETDRVLYNAFDAAPYNGFQAHLAILHAAKQCGVTVRRVQEAILAVNPDLPRDLFDRSQPAQEATDETPELDCSRPRDAAGS